MNNNNEENFVQDSLDNELELDTDLDVMGETTIQLEEAPREIPEQFAPNRLLHVPEEARQLYKEKGWDLYWVRFKDPTDPTRLDEQNLIDMENLGYQFVKRSEIPGLKTTFTGIYGQQQQDAHDFYIVGQNVLAKIPHAIMEAGKEYKRKKTEARSKAVINDLRKNAAMPDASRNEGWNITREQPKGREVELGD
jgi:hypothetical protein